MRCFKKTSSFSGDSPFIRAKLRYILKVEDHDSVRGIFVTSSKLGNRSNRRKRSRRNQIKCSYSSGWRLYKSWLHNSFLWGRPIRQCGQCAIPWSSWSRMQHHLQNLKYIKLHYFLKYRANLLNEYVESRQFEILIRMKTTPTLVRSEHHKDAKSSEVVVMIGTFS